MEDPVECPTELPVPCDWMPARRILFDAPFEPLAEIRVDTAHSVWLLRVIPFDRPITAAGLISSRIIDWCGE